MNDRRCLVCEQPLDGYRSDAKVHTACRATARANPHLRASRAFWQGIGRIRHRGSRTWLTGRHSSV